MVEPHFHLPSSLSRILPDLNYFATKLINTLALQKGATLHCESSTLHSRTARQRDVEIMWLCALEVSKQFALGAAAHHLSENPLSVTTNWHFCVFVLDLKTRYLKLAQNYKHHD
jgi:hypothetical protein